MSWSKQKEDLLEILESVSKIDPYSPETKNLELYLVKWMKIRKLATNLINREDLSNEDKQVPQSLLQKFKHQVYPILLEFSKSVKKIPIKELLSKFRAELQRYYALADENIKIVPMLSFSIYEDAQFFVNLYQFVLEKSLINVVKNEINYRMRVLKQSFEIESGTQNIEADLIQSTSSNVPPDLQNQSEILISEVKMPEEELLDALSGESYSELKSEIDINSSPQIQLQGNSVSSNTDDEIGIDSNLASSTIEDGLPIYQRFQPTRSYAYRKWFPENTWNHFANIRYCKFCGKKFLEAQRICSGCHQQYIF
ncbi:hypothetical protein NEF87_004448 [Candidatus Lokiarchaeum ossiferum]|uniref:Uncharacterized protein n=1 Tax=Candidatus Lokiarchaeum ossiferum TaxID=2951803 RepID=A0ABY6HXB1_9ARCH|nr:hypothetical protein NEF87_004448 [Candidatus Lokiarchaeum sp. B-35]